MSFDPSTLTSFRSLLIDQENIELKPYFDTQDRLTIGVGRNLEDVGISESEARMLLDNDIKRACLETDKAFPWMANLTPARQVVILSMAFNLGVTKLLEFKNMISAINKGDFNKASDEMLGSVWAIQVKRRAVDLAVMMKSGLLSGEEE